VAELSSGDSSSGSGSGSDGGEEESGRPSGPEGSGGYAGADRRSRTVLVDREPFVLTRTGHAPPSAPLRIKCVSPPLLAPGACLRARASLGESTEVPPN
jgi:hypothetical protein